MKEILNISIYSKMRRRKGSLQVWISDKVCKSSSLIYHSLLMTLYARACAWLL